MTNKQLYLMSAGVTACLTFAGAMLQATLPQAGERPLVHATAAALIDGCRLTGVIAESDSAVCAEFEVENPGRTDAAVEFSYSVQFTAGMSPMSRMMPMPRALTNGHCVVTVPAGASRIERIVVQPRLPAAITAAAKAAVTNEVAVDFLARTPDHWTLLVSRGEIGKAAGWGGVPPSAPFATNQLDKGVLVLASTPLVPAATLTDKR